MVAFDDGHGPRTPLTALHRITGRLTAVVAVAGDGSSSGRLRSKFGYLPSDDLCMALAVLYGDDQVGRRRVKVLQPRFFEDGPLNEYATGNLLMAGFWQQLDDPVADLDMVEELFGIQGRMLPTNSVPLQIKADVLGLDPLTPDELRTLAGQATVARTRVMVQSVRLVSENPLTHPETVAIVRQTDAIVLKPDSWFTSVIPHLLVPELRDAILSTSARRILVMNITIADEADGFTASRHTELLAEHAPTLRLGFVPADVGFVGSDCHLTQFVASLEAELAVVDIRYHDGSACHGPKRLADVYQEFLTS